MRGWVFKLRKGPGSEVGCSNRWLKIEMTAGLLVDVFGLSNVLGANSLVQNVCADCWLLGSIILNDFLVTRHSRWTVHPAMRRMATGRRGGGVWFGTRSGDNWASSVARIIPPEGRGGGGGTGGGGEIPLRDLPISVGLTSFKLDLSWLHKVYCSLIAPFQHQNRPSTRCSMQIWIDYLL